MSELTQPMLDALKRLHRFNSHRAPTGVAFSTMTALVRRGLVERHSRKVVEYRYSCGSRFDLPQSKDPNGWWDHAVWWSRLTKNGYRYSAPFCKGGRIE